MFNQLEIILTKDGSQTVQDSASGVTYHSINGAITESKHVFIEAGLRHLTAGGERNIKILEIGFGTGLNAFLTFLEAQKRSLSIQYTAIEAFPLQPSITSQLEYPALLGCTEHTSLFHQMHSPESIHTGEFELKVIKELLQETQLPTDNMLVFYDAFGPRTQGELWELDILKKIADSMQVGGILVTYCAQGQFKRNLKQAGFDVESIPGPPGKREMVRAKKRIDN